MQIQKGSCYSNIRTDLDWGREDEHHILVEEQKACRARARKLSLETNRRRKALEERIKEEYVREQKLREDILQQRKHRVQDATERFQRAHLPPSQRNRQGASRRATPHLEDVLALIQTPLNSTPMQTTFIRRPFSNSPSADSNTCRNQRQLNVAMGYGDLIQDGSDASLLQETQASNQKQFQDFQEVGRLDHSESLSSLDSLENQDFHHAYNRSASCSSMNCFDLNSAGPRLQNNCSCLFPASDTKYISQIECITDDVKNCHDKLSASSQSPVEETTVSGNNSRPIQVITEPRGDDQNVGKNPSHQAILLQGEITGNVDPLAYQSESHQKNSCKVPIATPSMAWSFQNTMPIDFSCLKQENTRPQNINQTDKYSSQPSAAYILQSTNQFNCKDHSSNTYTAPSHSSTEPGGASVKPPENCKLYKNPSNCAAKNVCNKEANSETKKLRSRTSEPLNIASKTNHVKVNGTLEMSDSSSVSITNDGTCVKGILKKESKYSIYNSKSAFSTARCNIPKKGAVSIKDSLELVKQKYQESESSKTMKKKLRWFDQVPFNEHVEEIKAFRDPSTNNKVAYPSQVRSVSVEHQEVHLQAGHLTTALGPAKAMQVAQITAPAVSDGLVLAKHAWGPNRVHDRKVQEQGEEGRVEKAGPRSGRPRVPRRVRSARARLSSATSNMRKGVVIRPLSATEATQVLKSQGKIMVPRPPPRPGSPEGKQLHRFTTDEAPLNLNKTPENESYSTTFLKDVPDGYSMTPNHSVHTADNDPFTPFLPSGTVSLYDTDFKPNYSVSSGLPNSKQQPLGVSSRLEPVNPENGLCLGRTPTDEEISQLWHGVRSALASKDGNEGDPQNFPTQNDLFSALPQGRASLSQITIDGGSLIGGVKGMTRMGAFFVSTANSAKCLSRRKLTPERNRAEYYEKAEQQPRRQAPGSGPSKPPIPQASVQKRSLINKMDQTTGVSLPDEVSESTAQFLVAEYLAKSSLADTDIMAAMEMVQTQKQAFLQQRVHNLSALSLEEQKLMQSLDHLNHRLQYVQEAVGGHSSVPGLMKIATSSNPLSQMGVSQQRYGTFSSDSRSGLQRRY